MDKHAVKKAKPHDRCRRLSFFNNAMHVSCESFILSLWLPSGLNKSQKQGGSTETGIQVFCIGFSDKKNLSAHLPLASVMWLVSDHIYLSLDMRSMEANSNSSLCTLCSSIGSNSFFRRSSVVRFVVVVVAFYRPFPCHAHCLKIYISFS